MATDKLGDFSQFLDVQADMSADTGIDMLLTHMADDKARQLKLCAIPHHFHPGILQVLDPSLDRETAERRCDEFARLAVVHESEYGLALHDSARRRLFSHWLAAERSTEFRAANERLKNYLLARLREGTGDAFWTAQRAYIFHLIGVDQEEGIAELTLRYNQASAQFALEECEILVNLGYEYAPVLTVQNLGRIRYFDAKLASDQQRWKDAVRLLKTIIDTDDIDSELLLKAHERLGMVYRINRNWKSAIANFDEALKIAKSSPDLRIQRTRILQNVGATYRDKGDYDRAEKILNKCIKLNEKPRNEIGLATSYNALGILHRQLANTASAIEAFERALEILKETDNSYRTAQIYNNLGLAYADERQWQNSEKAFRASLSVKEALDDEYGQAKTLINLVRISVARGMLDEAIARCQKAIALFGRLGARFSLAQAHRNLGKIYRRANQPDLAENELRKALELFERIKDRKNVELTKSELDIGHHRKDKLPWWAKVAIWFVPVLILLLLLIGAFG